MAQPIKQMGSNITAERLRFDFSFDRKLAEEEIKQVEDLVNQKIEKGLVVEMEEMPTEQALKEAGSSFGKTSIEGMKAAIAGYIVPFMFIFCPLLLLQGPLDPLALIITLASILIAFLCLTAGMLSSFLVALSYWERVLFIICAIGLLVGTAMPNYIIIAAGIVIFALLTFYQVKKKQSSLALQV